MHDRPVIAYLSGTYARASDTFIRAEVRELRNLGYEVVTFGIRPPSSSELTSVDIADEYNRTEYILRKENGIRLIGAVVRTAVVSPRQFASAVGLALRSSPPGAANRLWSLAYVMEACFLKDRLARKAVTHLHVHIAEGAGLVAMLAAGMNGIPYSLTIHGPGEFDRAATLAFDEKIARAAFAVAVSDYGRSQILRWIREADWPKVRVVHCGVDEDFLSEPASRSPNTNDFVFVGRLVHDKGVVPLLDAVTALAAEGRQFHVRIIGDGPLRILAERTIKERRLEPFVSILGWKSAADVRAAILQSRAFVLPSFAENLPVSIMEALALSRPVISTYLGGIPELVRDGVNGWLVPAGNARALAGAMCEALTADRTKLDAMGRAGAALVREHHSSRTEASKLAELFRAAQKPVPDAVPEVAAPVERGDGIAKAAVRQYN